MQSINRQVFELKAVHPRQWNTLTNDQKRLWVRLVDAGVPVEKSYRQIRLSECELCHTEIPKGQTRCDACEAVHSPFKGL